MRFYTRTPQAAPCLAKVQLHSISQHHLTFLSMLYLAWRYAQQSVCCAPKALTARAGANAPGGSTTITALETQAKTLLGLEWQYWAAILSGLAGVLLLFYCTKNCCPFWSWTKMLVKLAWFVLKCGCKCGWCLVKALPREDSPEALRKEEVGHPVFPLRLLASVPSTQLQLNADSGEC